MNRPSDGEYFEERLQIGDIILIASDGLFDNLYEDFIVQIVNNHHLVSLIDISIERIFILNEKRMNKVQLNPCKMLVKWLFNQHIMVRKE